MSDDDGTPRAAGPRWRDALLVTLVAVVLLAGLVHYREPLTRGADDTQTALPAGASTAPDPRGGSTAPTASPGPSGSAAPGSPAPTAPTGPADPTASADPTAPVDPLDPSASSEPTATPTAAATCWDGREATALSSCGDPDGLAGLAWVFPSFEAERSQCRPVTDQDGRNYEVVLSYLCAERALGRPVSVVYDQVADPAQVAAWLRAKEGGRLTEQPGAHGGRLTLVDTTKRPARITSAYAKFPFVVSVFAPDAASAERAWERLVVQRPPQAVRGTRS